MPRGLPRGVSLQVEFEFLFDEFSAPLLHGVFFGESETRTLVKQSCPVQSLECPEKDLPVTGFAAEFNGFVQKQTPQSPAVKSGIHDEPAEPCAFVFRQSPVNGHGAPKGPVHEDSPEAVSFFLDVPDEV